MDACHGAQRDVEEIAAPQNGKTVNVFRRSLFDGNGRGEITDSR